MNIIKKKISELTPAPYNPRKIAQTEFERLKRSIQEFGYVEPLIFNERTGFIVGGHQRLKALKDLGYEEVDCFVIDCDEEKEKALNVTLNKLSGTWDRDKLFDLLDDLDDVEITGYSNSDVADYKIDKEFKERQKYWGDNRERTYDLYRLHEYNEKATDGKWQIPKLKACHSIPDFLTPYDNIRSNKKIPPRCGVHFFMHDYVFENVWKNPYKVMSRLQKYDCVFTPNFSLYVDMPLAMKMWNIYRSMLIGQIMQNAGLQVIPSLAWSEPDTFDFCFDGIEQGGVVAVSTIGHMENNKWIKLWQDGMYEALKRIKPECILLYGFNLNIDFDWGEFKVKRFKTHMLDRDFVRGVLT